MVGLKKRNEIINEVAHAGALVLAEAKLPSNKSQVICTILAHTPFMIDEDTDTAMDAMDATIKEIEDGGARMGDDESIQTAKEIIEVLEKIKAGL